MKCPKCNELNVKCYPATKSSDESYFSCEFLCLNNECDTSGTFYWDFNPKATTIDEEN